MSMISKSKISFQNTIDLKQHPSLLALKTFSYLFFNNNFSSHFFLFPNFM